MKEDITTDIPYILIKWELHNETRDAEGLPLEPMSAEVVRLPATADAYFLAAKYVFYGDEAATPEDYDRKWDCARQVHHAYLVPVAELIELNVASVRANHLAWHDMKEAKEQEQYDREEYERLKRKYKEE
jgi:hypothetical protein